MLANVALLATSALIALSAIYPSSSLVSATLTCDPSAVHSTTLENYKFDLRGCTDESELAHIITIHTTAVIL